MWFKTVANSNDCRRIHTEKTDRMKTTATRPEAVLAATCVLLVFTYSHAAMIPGVCTVVNPPANRK